ncbi:MAG TPA: hypothetical protein VJW20_07265 [Candidatus Angelobacter sp.]|nr:hypothetical protein [Candidatus Angelobacter sp.]
MTTSIETLQAELETLQTHKPNPGDSTGIADDDPELSRYLAEPDSEIAKLFPKLVATDLAGAKRKLAQSRHEKSLLATAANEALPIQQRIEAAVTWRSLRPAGNRWASLSEGDLVESLTPHPDHDRLEQLSKQVCNPVVTKKDWHVYLGDMWAAISEFNALRQKFPLRDVPVTLSLEAVAGRVIKNSPAILDDPAARQEIYTYARDLQGRAS